MNMKRVSIMGIWMTVAVLSFAPFTALAEQTSGLSTNYSKLTVDNLPIGQTVSMIQIANAPMLVGNNYEIPVYVNISTEVPTQLSQGYEPIPDPNWILVEPSGMTLDAASTMKVDVKIALPDDETLFGKKYQCNIVIYTRGDPAATGVRYGTQLTGLFMFSVAPVRNESGLERALNNPANADYEINPPRVEIWGVKPGQKVKVRDKNNKKVEIINHSAKRQNLYLSAVDPLKTEYSRITNSQPAKVAEDVLIQQDDLWINPRQKKALDISIQVPKDADFTLGPLLYLVAVSSGSTGGVTRYLGIYLSEKESAAAQKKKEIEAQELKNATPQAVTPTAGIK